MLTYIRFAKIQFPENRETSISNVFVNAIYQLQFKYLLAAQTQKNLKKDIKTPYLIHR